MKRNGSSLPLWRVTLIGNRGRDLGDYRAADPNAAIKRAIREFPIDDPYRQKRLLAYRVMK